MYDELVERLRAGTYTVEELSIIIPKAADAIEELSREKESLAKSVNDASEILRKRWIPVAERLPGKNGSYLVYVYGEVTEMNFWHGKWHRLRDDYTKAVSHWMPPPEPPKEEKTIS